MGNSVQQGIWIQYGSAALVPARRFTKTKTPIWSDRRVTVNFMDVGRQRRLRSGM